MLNEYLSQISDLLHGEFFSYWYTEINKDRDDAWLRLFAARDLMSDNIEALHVDVEKCSGTILGVYGFMQALYLQQGALMNIYECIKEEKLNINHFENMKKARDIRNEEIGGHPVCHGKTVAAKDRRYNVLAPHLINGWKITICDHAKGLIKEAIAVYDLLDLRDKQEQEIEKILAELLKFVKAKIKAHKEKFMHEKISDLFKGLCLSRIMQAISDPIPDNIILAESECSFLIRQAESFLAQIAARNEQTADFEAEVKEFIWGLENIIQYCRGTEEDKLHAYLLWRGLGGLFTELKGYAQEIDNRYSMQ